MTVTFIVVLRYLKRGKYSHELSSGERVKDVLELGRIVSRLPWRLTAVRRDLFAIATAVTSANSFGQMAEIRTDQRRTSDSMCMRVRRHWSVFFGRDGSHLVRTESDSDFPADGSTRLAGVEFDLRKRA